MELHQLRYFAVLAETRNYTAAAEKCYVSRQALRQAVQSMEKEYGAVLVENRHNRLYLTPAGELLAAWCEKLCADWDEMNAALRSFIREPLHLRLGISVSLLPLYAPEQLEKVERLRAVFPTLTIESVLLDADSILRRLRDDELDAAILVDMGVERQGLSRTVLRRDELESTGRSVPEIATRCGFSDGNYFKDVFKKYYGLTPREYRRKKKGNLEEQGGATGNGEE